MLAITDMVYYIQSWKYIFKKMSIAISFRITYVKWSSSRLFDIEILFCFKDFLLSFFYFLFSIMKFELSKHFLKINWKYKKGSNSLLISRWFNRIYYVLLAFKYIFDIPRMNSEIRPIIIGQEQGTRSLALRKKNATYFFIYFYRQKENASCPPGVEKSCQEVF